MTDLFATDTQHPESVLISLYNAYPRRTGRPAALKRINESLNRICMGEIDGQPRTQADAILYLRERIEEHRKQMAGREQKWIPHMATWLHGRRYLRPSSEELMPARMVACVCILAVYPKMPSVGGIREKTESFMPVLVSIDKALERLENAGVKQTPEACAGYLESRVHLYAAAVKRWPVEDLQYVPNPKKWFDEERYNQNEKSWNRQVMNSFAQEREQIRRLIQ